MSCEAVKPFLYRVSQLASWQTGTGKKDAENQHQGQNQLEKVLPSQANETVFTGVCRAQRSAVDQLATQLATMSCLLQCLGGPVTRSYLYIGINSLARIEIQLASYQLTQFAQVKVTQLDKASMLDGTAPQQSFTNHQLARYLRYLVPSLVSQLASYLT